MSDYDGLHRRLRKRWVPIVAQGRTTCTRFGHPLFPDCPGLIAPGAEWHLGHDDFDRSRWTGPEHGTCNVRASNLKRDGLLNADPRPRSREW